MVSQTPPRHRNHLLWIGPIVTFLAVVTYFTFFTGFAWARDFPWINLPLVLLGLGISTAAWLRPLARPELWRGRFLGAAGLAVSLLLGGLFGWYVFFYSYGLPPGDRARTLERAPEFRLPDAYGRTVELTEFRGRKVVLTFYRGYW
jgi:hypothetical protein